MLNFLRNILPQYRPCPGNIHSGLGGEGIIARGEAAEPQKETADKNSYGLGRDGC
jgi:hypothetical protein